MADVQMDEPEALAQAILQACGWGQLRQETAVEAAIRHLRASTQLLLLDNLEHLPCAAEFCLHLLTADPTLTILATSRQRLGLQREVVRLLEGLPTPKDEGDTAVASVTLFVERVQRMDATFRLTPATTPHLVRICRALNGWPLPLELAASWAEVMSIAEISERVAGKIAALHTTMPDIPTRQRSMHAVLAGSYALLTPAEQQILTRFALFQGGCTSSAAAHILHATPAEMSALVRRALLHEHDGRYTIHELIRQFATELLEKSPDKETAAQAHAEYYLGLPVALTEPLHGADPLTAVNQLRPERENIYRAWHWAVQAEQYDLLSAALRSLTRFYTLTGLLQEGEALLRETNTAVVPPPFSDDLRLAHANLLLRLGNYPAARAQLQSLPPLDSLPPTHQLYGYHLWGEWYMLQDQIPEARAHSGQALALARQLDDHALIIANLARLDSLYDYDTPYQTELLGLVDGVKDRWWQRYIHSFLGAANIRHGRYPKAHTHWQQTLTISLQFEDWYTAANLYNNMGDVLRQLGQYATAESYFQHALSLYDTLNNGVLRMNPLEGWARLCIHRGQYAEALPLAEEAYALATAHGSQITQITASSCLGHAYVGLQLWSQAEKAYRRTAVLLPDLPRWAMESVVGLAYVAWQRGDEATARAHSQQFLTLLAHSPLEGSCSPSLSYGRMIQVLQGLGEAAQAAELYAMGQQWLDEQAQHLTGAELTDFWAAQAIHWHFGAGNRHPPKPAKSPTFALLKTAKVGQI
jgi:predicted ATPase